MSIAWVMQTQWGKVFPRVFTPFPCAFPARRFTGPSPAGGLRGFPPRIPPAARPAFAAFSDESDGPGTQVSETGHMAMKTQINRNESSGTQDRRYQEKTTRRLDYPFGRLENSPRWIVFRNLHIERKKV